MKENIIILIIVFAIIIVMRVLTRLREDISYTNYILHKVAIKSGLINEDIDVLIKELIFKGESVRAIKLYMTLTRKNFKEAREYIDNLIKNL